jgi:putative alpha-1,2-mannosidase
VRIRLARGALAAALTFGTLVCPGSAAAASPKAQAPALVTDPTAYVDRLIGTGRSDGVVGEINNFPGPSVPFGMMQFSPDTRDSYAGYQYHNDRIRAFSLTHAAAGCHIFGDVPILPVTGDLGSAPWNRTEHYSHAFESAEPGYYAVTLDTPGSARNSPLPRAPAWVSGDP